MAALGPDRGFELDFRSQTPLPLSNWRIGQTIECIATGITGFAMLEVVRVEDETSIEQYLRDDIAQLAQLRARKFAIRYDLQIDVF